jgi:hypothetical protein
LSERLARFAQLPGLRVCTRSVLTARRQEELLRQHPDLTYAVLMPWIHGPTWMEILLEKRALSPEESLRIARAFTEILAGMEEQGVAHCDLSGANLIIPALAVGRAGAGGQAVELVDVEQLFGPGLERPEELLAGSQGYAAHHASQGDLWNSKADRFAGAMLLGEMLGWCDEKVREAAWGETYFDPEEIQHKDSKNYELLVDALRSRWGGGIADLFAYAWRSESLQDCPTFGEWLVQMPGKSVAGLSTVPTGNDTVSALMARARELEKQGDIVGALAIYRQAQQAASANGGLAAELGLIIAGLETQLNRPQQASEITAAMMQPQQAVSERERLFNFALAAYNRGEWSGAQEMLREVVRQEPGYTSNGQSAAALLGDVDRRIAAQAVAPSGVAASIAAQPAGAVAAAQPVSVPLQQPESAAAPPFAVTPPAPPTGVAASPPSETSSEPSMPWAAIIGILVALVLVIGGGVFLLQNKPSAQGPDGQGNGVDAAATSTAQVAAQIAAQIASTATAAAFRDATATTVAAALVVPTATPQPPATPTAVPTPAPQQVGMVSFRDDIQPSDQVVVTLDPAPPIPQGKGLMGWLTNSSTGEALRVGRLIPDAANKATLTYTAPDRANLLGLYDGFKATAEELETNPSAPSPDVLVSDQLPGESVVHIRHLLVSDPELPKQASVEAGMRGQLDVVLEHAGYMRDDQAAGKLANVKLHAEHLVNIIEGAKGPHYGDLNKDGAVQNPGDGVGLLIGNDQLGYLQHARDHAAKSAALPDATDNIKLHAGHVDISVGNVVDWVGRIRDLSLDVLTKGNLTDTKPLSDEILVLANRAIHGQPVGEGQVEPIKGSGGAETSYLHAQLMAGIPLYPGDTAKP